MLESPLAKPAETGYLRNGYDAARRHARSLAVLCFVVTFLAWPQPDLLLAQSPIALDEGLSVVAWSDAEQVVGQTVIVTGKIVDVGRSGRVNFLNFDARRRDVFKVVVFEQNLSKFPQSLAELYRNQLVAVRGRVTLYRDVPQIEVAFPSQIQVLDRLPESRIVQPQSKKLEQRIRVATFNIRNLFDDHDDPYLADETTPAKPRLELERLAQTLREINADAVALQEVESRGYLQRFNQVFLANMGYEVVHYAGNDQRGSGLAVLSRIPIGQVTSHRHRQFRNPQGETCRFSRDLLCVELLHPATPAFELWVVHLKSKRGDQAETELQRMAESSEIRRLFEAHVARSPDARILLLGDFNDTPMSRPILNLLASDKILGLFENLPEDAITYNQAPHQSMIDFMFASPQARAGYVSDSYRIVDQTLQQSGSDHNAVVAEFDFGE